MNPILVLSAVLAGASSVPEFVEDAFSRMHDHQAGQCSFVRVMKSDDESTKESYTPGSIGWQLLEVNGEDPGEKDLKDYADDAENRSNRTLPTEMEFDDLAVTGSYQLIEESESEATWEFAPEPRADDDSDIVEHLLGKLTIDKVRPGVARLEMSNTQPFSPALGVKVKNMYQKIEYQWLDDQETFVMRQVVIQMSGKAFGLKKISQDVSVSFSEFSCSRVSE